MKEIYLSLFALSVFLFFLPAFLAGNLVAELCDGTPLGDALLIVLRNSIDWTSHDARLYLESP